MTEFLSILKKYWGHDGFRPLQEQTIRTVYDQRDALVLMPTGGGKSVTYQVPGLAQPGVCVVITPLIALMKDQTDALRQKGILSVCVHSGMTPRQIDIALDRCVYGDYKFLYIVPERIDSEMFRARFAKMKVSLVAVDEAHCISQWGYDFRPSYLKISRLRQLAPDAPFLALTASATDEVVADIVDKLELRDPSVLRMTFSRENLNYVVRRAENKTEQLLRVIRNVPGSGIVYARTRERTEKIAAFLRDNGISADFYHAGLGYFMRGIKQDKWIKGENRVIVATNAFGMGIDKADVRFVIHADMTDSPEAYYQEAGRAGRDGKPAYAVLLLNGQDQDSARLRIAKEFPPLETIRLIYEQVCNFFQVETGTGKGLARTFNIYEFCAKYKYRIPTVVNALKILQLNDYMTLTDETDHPPRVMFTVSREDLYKIRVDREELDYFIKTILRTYPGVFSDFVSVNENELAHLSGYTPEKVHDLFKRLWQLRIIKYIPGNRGAMIIFMEERLSTDNLRISPESYRMRKEAAEQRQAAMIAYSENVEECRSLLIQRYFGEKTDEPCGKCDICRSRRSRTGNQSPTGNPIRQKLLESLAQGPLDIQQIMAVTKGEAHSVLDEIRFLLDQSVIRQLPDGRLASK